MFTGYEDDTFEVISTLHVQESKLGGKCYKYGKKKKKKKKIYSGEFIEFFPPMYVHQLIGNLIITHFDPKMGSLGLLEAKINPKQRSMGNYCHDCFFVVVVVA